MSLEKLELMIIDDDPNWLDLLTDGMSRKGYDVVTAKGSYQAIDQIAIRLSKDRSLPDIFLCDMLDRNQIIAKITVRDELKNIYVAMAYNMLNYLATKGIKPEYFVAQSAFISPEDA